MTSKFRHVALVGKYQASTASDASTAQSREVLQDIADFLQTQGCEVIVEAETAAHTGLGQLDTLQRDRVAA